MGVFVTDRQESETSFHCVSVVDLDTSTYGAIRI